MPLVMQAIEIKLGKNDLLLLGKVLIYKLLPTEPHPAADDFGPKTYQLTVAAKVRFENVSGSDAKSKVQPIVLIVVVAVVTVLAFFAKPTIFPSKLPEIGMGVGP